MLAVKASQKRTVLTPEASERLVWKEAVTALTDVANVTIRPQETFRAPNLARLFALPPERSGLTAHPDLIFSINFHGLDKHGEAAAILRQKGVPVAVWCVDNPWNLLSGLRDDFWKEFHLFVTDPSFIKGLLEHGAKHVSHLPLATDPSMFHQNGPLCVPPALQPVVFVGRSSFPGKERFFVGQNIPAQLLGEACLEAETGNRPDFFWWLDKLAAPKQPPILWPGNAARKATQGAEETSLRWRSACLQAILPYGLTIYGDSGWKTHICAATGDAQSNLPKPDLRAMVDYYTHLPAIYATANFSLVTTSFLLPHGLNQRHFDVWCSNGFALLDATPGLALFPSELTRPVTFATPSDIPILVKYFAANQKEKNLLTNAWHQHILAEHTYEKRIQVLLHNIFT